MQQSDGSSCGPLTLAATASWLQGRLPDAAWMGGIVLKNDRARVLRQSQFLDVLALVLNESRLVFADIGSSVTDLTLRGYIRTAENRVRLLSSSSDVEEI